MSVEQSKSAPLSRKEARELTDRIKRSVEQVWVLVCEAHERRAWVALGLPSWDAYVRSEFGMARSRAYQLLDQGTVIRAIAQAADVSTPVDVTEAVARDVKPHLAEVVEQVRDAVQDLPADERVAVAEQVVVDAREKFIADRRTGEVTAPPDVPTAAAEPVDEPVVEDPPDWSPSSSIEQPAPTSTSTSKPTGSKSKAPASVLEQFASAVFDVRRAVERMDRLSANPLFQTRAETVAIRHRVALDDAVETLGLVLGRIPTSNGTSDRPVAAEALISSGGGTPAGDGW